MGGRGKGRMMGDATEKAESSHLIYNGRSEKRGASGSSEATLDLMSVSRSSGIPR
ncbi:MAG: hypothetical protein ACK53Y_23965 [bacterium]